MLNRVGKSEMEDEHITGKLEIKIDICFYIFESNDENWFNLFLQAHAKISGTHTTFDEYFKNSESCEQFIIHFWKQICT